MTEAGDGEDFFNDQAAGEDAGGEGPGVGEEGKDGGAKGVEEDEGFFGDAFGPSGADEIGADGFKEAGPG